VRPWQDRLQVEEHVSPTKQRANLGKIGAKVVRQGRGATFQLTEVAGKRGLFEKLLCLIDVL